MKKNSIFSSVGEAGMIVLLVALFVTPFLVATLLTPGYDRTPTRITELEDDSARINTRETNQVLGATAETIKDVRMQVVNGSEIAVADSYVTSDVDGRFLYRVTKTGTGVVFKLENEGTAVTEAKLKVVSEFSGTVMAGSKKLGDEFSVVRIGPNSDLEVSVQASSLGKFELLVVID